ncbi:hypothetical protein C0J52_27661 [Blattella germanica]|nr:hypothetical protein C0J52_27661 [Blattella germanica]
MIRMQKFLSQHSPDSHKSTLRDIANCIQSVSLLVVVSVCVSFSSVLITIFGSFSSVAIIVVSSFLFLGLL